MKAVVQQNGTDRRSGSHGEPAVSGEQDALCLVASLRAVQRLRRAAAEVAR